MQIRFDCFFYYVADLARSIAFYTQALGLKLESRDAVARFDIDGVLFELVPALEDRELAHGGNGRLCLRVDDIHQATEELRQRGTPTSEVEEKENGMVVTLEDPDGNEICLWEYR